MTFGKAITLLVTLSLLFLCAFAAVAQFSIPANKGFASSAAVLSLITATAIGIERVIECFWTIIGMTKGTWYPMNLLSQQVEGMLSNLNVKLTPFYDEANKAIDNTKIALKWTEAQADAAKKEVAELKNQIESLKKLAPDSQQANLIAASAFQGVSYLEKKYPELENAALVANQAVTGVADFVATFKDNPARRLISIYIGAILGLIVAGILGLDVFKAAMDTSADTAAAIPKFFPNWAVAFTGLLMGLGSNPTHEVIRAIQEVKKSRKSGNDPVPNFSNSGEAGGYIDAMPGRRPPSKSINTFSLHRF